MSKIIPPFNSPTDRGYKFLRVFDQFYIAKGGRLLLRVEGGIPPYDWVVTGTDFTLDEAQTALQYNFLNADDLSVLDNTELVTITDANNVTVEIVCCTCNPFICCDEASYSFSLDLTGVPSPTANRNVPISVIGGCPPYDWEITHTIPTGLDSDYEFEDRYTNDTTNKLWGLEDALPGTSVAIQVTDGCNNQTEVDCTGPGIPRATNLNSASATGYVLNHEIPPVSTWSGLHDAVSGTAVSTTGNLMINTRLNLPVFQQIWRCLLRFSLVGLSPSLSLTGASLRLTVNGTTGFGAYVVLTDTNWGGSTLVVGDYDNYINTLFADDPIHAPPEFQGGENLTFTLNSLGLAKVQSKLGSTVKFSLREYTYDYLDIAPSTTPGNGVSFFGRLTGSGSQRPRLTVNYKDCG